MAQEGKNRFIDELRESRDALTRSAYNMLEERIHQLERHRAQLEWLLEKNLSSRSWRITAPLRTAVHYARTFWPLLTKRESVFSAEIGHNVLALAPGRFQVLGPGAHVSLKLIGDDFVRGACLCHVELGPNTKRLQGYLSYDRGGGFIESEREFLTIDATMSDGEQLVHLPPDTRALRFEPFLDVGSFEIRKFSLKKLGSITLYKRYLENRPRRPKLGSFFPRARKAILLLRQGGFSALRMRMLRFETQGNYHEWVRRYDTLQPGDIAAMQRHQAQFNYQPRISVIMPVCNPDDRWLKRAIESVLTQVYQNFELCIADDHSDKGTVRALLHEYQTKDSRVKVTFRRERGHIGAASNSALSLAQGEYVLFLDHDDELAPHALYCFAERLQSPHRARLLYSDEDKVSEDGQRFSPHFKSEYDRELLRCQNYVCHCLCMERALVQELGGFHEGVDGAQDWDLVLRASERLSRRDISHVPHVLYHWRILGTSTASSYAAKPYVLDAQVEVVRRHIERIQIPFVSVEKLELISHVRPVYKPARKPSVTILILAGNSEGFKKEIFEPHVATLEIRTLPSFDSNLLNQSVREANGELIVFVRDGIAIGSESSVLELLSLSLDAGSGVVAPKIFDSQRKIRDAGIVLGMGGAYIPYERGRPEHDVGYAKRLVLRREASAFIGGCWFMRRDVFLACGGFDADFSLELAQVDLCLKLYSQGFRNIITPFVEVTDKRPVKATLWLEHEQSAFTKRWHSMLKDDPYYNENFSLNGELHALSFPPRAARPWLIR